MLLIYVLVEVYSARLVKLDFSTGRSWRIFELAGVELSKSEINRDVATVLKDVAESKTCIRIVHERGLFFVRYIESEKSRLYFDMVTLVRYQFRDNPQKYTKDLEGLINKIANIESSER